MNLLTLKASKEGKRRPKKKKKKNRKRKGRNSISAQWLALANFLLVMLVELWATITSASTTICPLPMLLCATHPFMGPSYISSQPDLLRVTVYYYSLYSFTYYFILFYHISGKDKGSPHFSYWMPINNLWSMPQVLFHYQVWILFFMMKFVISSWGTSWNLTFSKILLLANPSEKVGFLLFSLIWYYERLSWKWNVM